MNDASPTSKTAHPRLAPAPTPEACLVGVTAKHGCTVKRSPPTAFSLVELLVVIAVIAILIGMVVIAASNVREGTKSQQTKVLLVKLDNIATEYRILTDQTIDTPNNNDISDFLIAVKTIPDARQMLSSLNPELYNSTNNTVVDAWGSNILYSLSNRDNSQANYNANLPIYDRLFFTSLGPDSLLGDAQASDADSKDNIYSFDVLQQ